jgi:epsin
MELDTRDVSTGPALSHLESFKTRASFLFKDSLKIARIALVDVSTAELMTEDATNADDWGPTTKAMADICNATSNSEDYLRIVQVLHKRFALNTTKHWRQIHKSLILLEYLLSHGPEHLVVEFRQDRGRLEEFARFDYVDWTGIDRGSPIQRRAKRILHLLRDEIAYKEERARAQKISRGILGFGSQSFYHRFRPESLDTFPYSRSTSSIPEKRDPSLHILRDKHKSSSGSSTPVTYLKDDISSPEWRNSAANSPTSVLPFNSDSPIHDMIRFDDEMQPSTPREVNPEATTPPPHSDANVSPRLRKLPPPPPVAEYKCVTAATQNASRVRQTTPRSPKPVPALPDLIAI